ncbi:MAG: VOC family protein [Desulfobacterales bacterium]|nr:VOC family protein [Desulfobacterales bacterium]
MTKVHHVALFVSDMDRALYLFQDILGLKRAWHAPEVKGNQMAELLGIPDIKIEIAYLQNGPEGAAVELCRMIHPAAEKTPQPFGSPGAVSLSLQVKGLDGLYERLNREGWPPLSEPVRMPGPDGNPLRLFCIRTEEGLTLELVEQKNESLS